MVKKEIIYIDRRSEEVVKMVYQRNGTPRCKCKSCEKTFQTEYINKGAKPETKRIIMKITVNGSGIGDI